MEIIKFLIDFFTKNQNDFPFSPLIKLLEQNSFDLKKLFSNLSFENILPIIESFTAQKKDPFSTKKESFTNPLTPITDICDAEIISALNSYFYE